MPILFHALPTVQVRALQNGQPDFYGQPAEATRNRRVRPLLCVREKQLLAVARIGGDQFLTMVA